MLIQFHWKAGPEPIPLPFLTPSSPARPHSSIAHVTTMSHHIFQSPFHQSTIPPIHHGENITILAQGFSAPPTNPPKTNPQSIHHPVNPRFQTDFMLGINRFVAKDFEQGTPPQFPLALATEEIEWTVWQELKFLFQLWSVFPNVLPRGVLRKAIKNIRCQATSILSPRQHTGKICSPLNSYCFHSKVIPVLEYIPTYSPSIPPIHICNIQWPAVIAI